MRPGGCFPDFEDRPGASGGEFFCAKSTVRGGVFFGHFWIGVFFWGVLPDFGGVRFFGTTRGV